jgi:hypothetical protein
MLPFEGGCFSREAAVTSQLGTQRVVVPTLASADQVAASSGLCRRHLLLVGHRMVCWAGEEHWHGAAPDRFMTHIAMQEADDSGSPVTWGARHRRAVRGRPGQSDLTEVDPWACQDKSLLSGIGEPGPNL